MPCQAKCRAHVYFNEVSKRSEFTKLILNGNNDEFTKLMNKIKQKSHGKYNLFLIENRNNQTIQTIIKNQKHLHSYAKYICKIMNAHF